MAAMKRLLLISPLVVSVLLASQAETKNLGTITVKVPAGWKSAEPKSPMRKAQFALPKAEGDREDAELVVFNFGAGQGGGVQANLDRWYGQFKQTDGTATRDKAKVTKKKIDGMEVTIVDVSGTYVAPKQIGNPAAGTYNEPNWRMLAAIVPAPESDYFFKLVGPAKTVAKWAKSFDAFVNSVKKN